MSRGGAAGSRRVALLVAAVLGAALVAVIALATPWDVLPVPPGGRTPVDPDAAFGPEQVARAEAFAAALRPASLTSLVLSLLVSAVFGLTRAGAATARAVARPLGGGWAWQVLLGSLVILLVGRLVTLPLSGNDRDAMGRVSLRPSRRATARAIPSRVRRGNGLPR